MTDTQNELRQELSQIDASIRMLHQQLAALEKRDSEIRGLLNHHDLDKLQLSRRTHNALHRAGLRNVSDVLSRLRRGQDSMLAIRDFGEGALNEVLHQLLMNGYTLHNISE